jgi:cysteine-rich repeat protein
LGLASCAVASETTSDTLAADTTDLCGNGVRDKGEQCDDGNRNGLDGCSASCTFEQFQRMNSVTMLFGTDSFCSSNALGGAVGSQAQSRLQQAITDAVNGNQLNVLFSPDGLTDLTGQNAASISLGSFVGDAVQGSNAGLDAWYTVQSNAVSLAGTSSTALPGTITNGALSAGPGNLAFSLALGGAGAEIALSATRAKAMVGSSSVPTSSAGSSPGHVAGEHLDPALKAFATTSSGQLCGNASAASLAAIPVPEQLAQGSSTACSQNYTTTGNSMLDVFVGGCSVFIVTAINATQPDKMDPNAAAAGAGGPYKLVAGSNHKVSSCKDKSGANVDLNACLKGAAYSAGFKFTTQRVIVKGTTH